MRRISIIALLALMVTIIEAGYGVYSARSMQLDRATDKALTKELSKKGFGLTYGLNVIPDKSLQLTDSIYNKEAQVYVPSVSGKVYVPGVFPGWTIWVALSITIVLIVFITKGLWSCYKFLMAIFRKQVFTPNNACRLRRFVYYSLLAGLLSVVMDWSAYHFLAEQVTIPGYIIQPYTCPLHLSELLVMVLFTEIFAYGVKLQEEQNLTI